MSTPGEGYLVYPESLRSAAEGVHQAAEDLTRFAVTDLASVVLDDGDLGVLGQGVVTAYNEAIEEIRQKAAQGAKELWRLGETLDKSADYYEAQDEEEYQRLKKLGEGLN